MKTKLLLFCVLLFSVVTIAQNGINYKAIIKDASGNIVANNPVQIAITILEDATNVYTETHALSSDANGIVIINIGEGSVISGVFKDIAWGLNNHFLNLVINIGDGPVDMGTTAFKYVPQAYYSDVSATSDQIMMFESGTNNPDEMVIQHSPSFSNWGLQYADSNDKFHFVAGGNQTLTVDLSSGNLTTEGKIGVGTQSPLGTLHVNSNSNGISQTVLLDEIGNDYARLGFKNNVSTANWDIAGLAANTPANARLNFYFRNSSGSGSNLMSIRGDGNVGVGISNPTSKLHVVGNARVTADLNVDETVFADDIIFDDGTRIYDRFNGFYTQIAATTNFIPSVDDVYNLGDYNRRWDSLWATDGTINSADRSTKTNITSINHGLDAIMQLQPVNFNWKKSPGSNKKLGLIAQDLLKVIPEVVKTHVDVVDEKTGAKQRVKIDKLGVYYSDLIPVLIKAIQEQQEMITDLKLEVQTLKTQRKP